MEILHAESLWPAAAPRRSHTLGLNLGSHGRLHTIALYIARQYRRVAGGRGRERWVVEHGGQEIKSESTKNLGIDSVAACLPAVRLKDYSNSCNVCGHRELWAIVF